MASETLPQRIRGNAERFPSNPIQFDKFLQRGKEDPSAVFKTVTYQDFWKEVSEFGAGLTHLGLSRGAHIGIVSDNRREWLIADIAILGLGAADVPRGSDSTVDEVAFILTHSDCTAVIVDDQTQLEKVLSGLPKKNLLKLAIVLDDSLPSHRKAPSSMQLLNFSEVLAHGRLELKKNPRLFEDAVDHGKSGDLATIIYTSGTTGEPKGVMLSHLSFLFQVDRILDILSITSTDVFLSVLPIWHSYERLVEYVVVCAAAAIAYSKPVGKVMLDDMAAVKPTWFTTVPRIWESIRSAVYRNIRSQGAAKQVIFDFFVKVGGNFANLRDRFLDRWPHFIPQWPFAAQIWTAIPLLVLWPLKLLGDVLVFNKLKALLGGRLIASISGGGALPGYVDQFFRSIGILVLEGYGLTETAPVLGVRLQKHPVPGTVGPLLKDIEFKVLEEETGKPLGPGHKGVLWVKTPQVMLGYYKRPDLTSKVLIDGWLNTGDLVMTTMKKEIRIIGRAKDTIVLRGGENIEPEPIEQKLLQSEFIDQVMVVGQDQKYLGALIVPNFELLEKFAKSRRIDYLEREELLDNSQIVEYVHEIVQYLINPRSGFKAFERIFRFRLLPKAFQVGVEMTASLKLKRNVIGELFAKEIGSLFEKESD